MILISVIIPVLNEQSGINEVIRHVRRISAGHAIEVIVADGDGGGSTLRAVEDIDSIRVISSPGRASQMNRGAERASGDVLLFLHADTLLPENAFDLIGVAIRSGRCQAGAFSLSLDSGRLSLRVIAAAARIRTRMTRIPFGDQALFMRRDYFKRIGGFAGIPLMEDVEIATRIKKRGDRILILPERVVTSARKWERDGVVYSNLRNWFIQLSYLLGASPERLVRIYYKN
jgi:rSAM/selenodomain-associated transferase 2